LHQVQTNKTLKRRHVAYAQMMNIYLSLMVKTVMIKQDIDVWKRKYKDILGSIHFLSLKMVKDSNQVRRKAQAQIEYCKSKK